MPRASRRCCCCATAARSILLSLLLGILIWADFPSSATWAIGLLVGIELIFAGSALIMAALAGRQLARSSTS